jgi:hypothetical protein
MYMVHTYLRQIRHCKTLAKIQGDRTFPQPSGGEDKTRQDITQHYTTHNTTQPQDKTTTRPRQPRPRQDKTRQNIHKTKTKTKTKDKTIHQPCCKCTVGFCNSCRTPSAYKIHLLSSLYTHTGRERQHCGEKR